MSVTKLLTVLVSLLPACVHAPLNDWCPYWGRADQVRAFCLDQPSVARYLAAMGREIAEQTRDAEPFAYDAYADLRFVLREGGHVAYRCFVRSSDRKLASLVLDAFDRAAPFSPIARHAKCLAGSELFRHIYVGPPR